MRHATDRTDKGAQHYRSCDQMMRMADIALYHAKRESRALGRSVCVRYRRGMTMPKK